MEKELMNKEVLCILDTRQIQRYIFKNNSFLETIGGGDLIAKNLEKAIEHAMTNINPALEKDEYSLSVDPDIEIPYFISDKIKFQLITYGAGNALCLVRTGELCQKIIRKLSRYYLDNTYSLNIVAAVTEKTGHLSNDIFNLYEKLNVIKTSCEILDPVGPLPVVIKEPRTGLPAICKDETTGEYYSKASQLRREAAMRRDLFIDIKDMQTTTGSDGKQYLAVIHADGNNLGITMGKILQNSPVYDEGIRGRRKVSDNISRVYRKITANTMIQMREYYESLDLPGKSDFDHAFNLFNQGGDDINVICDARLAIPFLNFLYENLNGMLLWESQTLKVPIYMCAGIAYVVKSKSFHSAYQLASDCCDNAKKFAKKEKNLRNGLAGNWIDFQVSDDTYTQELDLLREKAYITKDRINMQMRPYSLDPEAKDTPVYFYSFLDRVRQMKKANLTQQQLEMLRISYMMGRLEFGRWLEKTKENGLDLVELLGNSLYRDEDEQLHALWFDLAMMMDFVQE